MSDLHDALNEQAGILFEEFDGGTAVFRGVTIAVDRSNVQHARQMLFAGKRDAMDSVEFRIAARNVAGQGDPRPDEEIIYGGQTYNIDGVQPAKNCAWVLICSLITR